MPSSFRISTSQADDLATACILGAQRLREVAQAISSAELTIKREKLKGIIARVLTDQADAKKLTRLVFGLSTVSSRDASRIGKTVDGIGNTLGADFSADPRFASWPEVGPALLEILACDSVYLSAKAIQVAYDFEKILTGSRIITSVRPIFDDSRNEIVGQAVVQTLRLEFVTSAGRRESTSVAVDLADVERLIKTCNDAAVKAKVVRDNLKEFGRHEIITFGEGGDE